MSEIRKTYQIKSYWYDWTYKKTVNPSIVMKDITFTSEIRWWLWQMTVSLNLPISNDRFAKSDIIEVYCFDPENIDWRLIYRGVLTRIKRLLSNKGEFIILTCLWMLAFINRLVFIQSTAQFNKDQHPDLTLKNVIDYFNTIYTHWRISYSAWNIASLPTDISLDFDYTKCGEAMKKVQQATADRFFFIDADGDVTYKANSASTTNHRLKVTQEIDDFVSDEEVESVVNQLFLRRSGGVAGGANDPTSQTTYWRIDGVVSATNVGNLDSAIEYGTRYIDENKTEKKEIKLTVNSNYDIESIKPWHAITILNTDYETPPLQVQKVTYRYDMVTLELDRYSTFAQSILSDNISA